MEYASIISSSLMNNILKKNTSLYKMSLSDNSEIISNLKFIGLIEKHYKINVSNLSLQPVGPYTKFNRTFICYENSRHSALKFIERTINRSFDLVVRYAESDKISEVCLVKNILVDIIKSLEGIDNLQYTYDDDIKFKCDLKSIRQSIVPRLKEVHHHYSHLFKSEDNTILTFIGKIQGKDKKIRTESERNNIVENNVENNEEEKKNKKKKKNKSAN